jgi:hypothetical protein
MKLLKRRRRKKRKRRSNVSTEHTLTRFSYLAWS